MCRMSLETSAEDQEPMHDSPKSAAPDLTPSQAPSERSRKQVSSGHAQRLGTEVYAVYGVEPEVLAYAMAKYSRSALPMKEALREISSQKAEQFLNTFYFQYGHRSIADLAHLAFAVERLSLLAAIVLEDEQRWDGQERSTRYQNFAKPDYYVPDFPVSNSPSEQDTSPLLGDRARQLYQETIQSLFADYRRLSQAMFEHLCARTSKPSDMEQPQYDRTLKARAFDISRYLLPLATNTSLGQIVNARTLESQISRLLSHPQHEIRELGQALKRAAREPAYCFSGAAQIAVAPTLVKYADPSSYLINSHRELRSAAQQLFANLEVAAVPAVELLDDEPAEIELPASLLYEHCQHSYRQVRDVVSGLSQARRNEIVELALRHRGPHDELLRPFCAGQSFRFDILMDIGGFRDLHRHRRCIQLHQDFTFAHGYDTPQEILESGRTAAYETCMHRTKVAAAQLDQGAAQYLTPLAYRKRTLFKMDFAEVVYIAEIRTTPAGHFSYRRIAWDMCQAVIARHPTLKSAFRVHDPSAPIDLLNR
jgi:thymidylate synthase ThyX